MNSLLSIANELHAIELELLSGDGELSPETEERLSAATIAKERKIDSYASILERAKSIEAEFSARAERMMMVAKSAKRLQERLKDNLRLAMSQIGLDELSGDSVRFKLVSGKAKLVLDAIDERYCTQVVSYEPNKELIRAKLEAGESVPGARLDPTFQLRSYAPKALK